MTTTTDTVLVSLAGINIFFHRGDHAFSHVCLDPRAREIQPSEARVTWKGGELDPEQAWPLRGVGQFSLASIHYWRHGIDFDYVDIGANVGLTAVPTAVFFKRCGWANRVYAFEPGEIFTLLQQSVTINNIADTTTCIRTAASDATGTVTFHLTPAQSAGSSLLRAAVERPEVMEVRTTLVEAITLDQFALDNRSLRDAPGLLVKIDAEGADFRVIDGMSRLIEQRLCTILTEFTPFLIDGYCNPERRLTELAESFEVLDIGDTGRSRIAVDGGSVAQFVDRVRKKPRMFTDIMLVPKRLPGAQSLVERLLEG